MKLEFKKLSKEELKLVNKQWIGVSPYIDAALLRKISTRLGITKGLTKDITLNSLETLGWRSAEQNKLWRERRSDLWFSILEICVNEIDPIKRWDKIKLLIIESLTKWFDDALWGAFEIIRDPKQPFDVEPKGLFGFLDKPVLVKSIIEYCLQTVILFNAVEVNTPADVSYWRASHPNFCGWNFQRKGVLFKIHLKDGEIIDKYVPNLPPDIYKLDYVTKNFPEYKNQVIKSIQSPLPYWSPDNWLLDVWKLKVDLGEMYLSSLSKIEQIRVFKQLIGMIGFDPFLYRPFHTILKEWGREGKYNEIQEVLYVLKTRYSPKKLKMQGTKRDYALLAAMVLKKMKENKSSHRQASIKVSEQMKDAAFGTFHSIWATLTPELVRVRTLKILKEETKLRKIDYRLEEDLGYLLDRIKSKYDLRDVELDL